MQVTIYNINSNGSLQAVVESIDNVVAEDVMKALKESNPAYNLENAIWIVHPFSTMNYTKAQVKTTEAGSFAVHDGVPEIAKDEEFCDVMINEEAMEYYLVTTKNNIYPFFLPDRARDPKVPRSPYIEQGMYHYANN